MIENLQIGPKLQWKILNSSVYGLTKETQREVSCNLYIFFYFFTNKYAEQHKDWELIRHGSSK